MMAKYLATYCSQCGGEFGPGDHGYSSCKAHTPMKSYEFLTNMCFGPYVCRKVSVDYTVGQYDDVELLSVWTIRPEVYSDEIGEEITDFLTDEGKDYFQQLCEQDWRDRKQDEWELEQELNAERN